MLTSVSLLQSSVTWSFRNHADLLLKKLYYYYHFLLLSKLKTVVML